MSDLISGVINIRTFLSNNLEIIPYAECGEVLDWKLKESRQYIIPGYQREIKWSPENIQILFDDIFDKSKFLGNVLLSTSDKTIYHIIDGQQRLTAIFMILEKIRTKKENGLSIELCTYSNDTFPFFYEALQNNFIFEKTEEEAFLKSDVLNQKDTINKLWNCVCNNIDKLTEQEIIKLEDHLLDSTISVLISKVNPAQNESRRVCVDYFIDTNNKSVKLDCVDILKAYAFRENFDNASNEWIKIQKQEREIEGIYYPKEILFYHYFLCTVNSHLDYKVVGLSEDYKISKRNVHLAGKDYLIGTDIEILLCNAPHYYRTMLNRIIKYQEFMNIVKRDKSSPSEEFCNYFICDEHVDYDTKLNAFTIISGILKNSDVVPKLLVMKYYLEVLSKEHKNKDDLKLIYWINVLATFFSAAKTRRKSTDQFAAIVLKRDWKERLKEKAMKSLTAFPKGIGFDKVIHQDGRATATSGQYLARRLHGILASFYAEESEKWDYNEGKYKQIMNTSGSINDEHFLVNKSGKISFKYGISLKETFMELPKDVKSRVSYISNYIVIKSAINSEINNGTIVEKIKVIKRHIEAGETDVFANKFSEYLFEKIANNFEKSGCPTPEQLKTIENCEDAKMLLGEYYSSTFLEKYDEYIEDISSDDGVLYRINVK